MDSRSGKVPRRRKRLFFLSLLTALGSIACFTLTIAVDVNRNDDAQTLVGMQLGFEFDREILNESAGSNPPGGKSLPTSGFLDELGKKGWKIGRTENGETASREATSLQNLARQGWRVDGLPAAPGKIVTATLDITQLGSPGFKPDTVLKSIQLVVDQTDPLTSTYTYLASLVIPPNAPSAPSSFSPASKLPVCKPEDVFVKPCQLVDPSGDTKLSPRLEQAIQRAGPPKIVMAATLPITVSVATLNGAPTGVIASGNRVSWTLPIDKPGTYALRAVANVRELLPIIFLPGVGGSWLASEGANFNLNLWPASPSNTRYDLELLPDGKSSKTGARIRATDIMQSQPVNFYGGMIEFLKSKGYKVGVNLFPFPYDWRLDNSTHFSALDLMIKEAIEKSKKPKVILLTHSMGGLIARAYVFDSEARAAKVDSLVTIAAPYWGAPKPYYGLINGYTFSNPTVNEGFMKILIQNFPAAYQLMPTVPFVVDLANGRQLSLADSWNIHYHGIDSVRRSRVPGSVYDVYVPTADNPLAPNPRLIAAAAEFYSKVGTKASPRALPKGLKQYVIIGYGVSTLTEFRIRDPQPGLIYNESYLELGDNRRKVAMEPGFGDGDGTVPMWGLDIDGATGKYYVPYNSDDSTEHGSMTDNKRVQTIVGQILAGAAPNQDAWSYRARETNYLGCEQTGFTFSPYCTGIDFTLHSDAHLRITEPRSGQSLGLNDRGGVDETLGTYLNMNGVEYISLSDISRAYQVSVIGENEGKFSLNVDIKRDGKKTSFQYTEIPVKPGTLAEFMITPRQVTTKLPDLVVKSDGKVSSVPAKLLSSPSFLPEGLLSQALLVGGGLALLTILGLAGVVGLVLFTRRRASAQASVGESRASRQPDSKTNVSAAANSAGTGMEPSERPKPTDLPK